MPAGVVPQDPQDPAVLLARAMAQPASGPVANRFNIHIHSPDQDVTAWGGLVVRSPDQFRVEIAGPIGPPVLIVACAGKDVNAWLATQQNFYVGEGADHTLRQLTGGAAGLDVLTALLVGQLPAMLGAPSGAAASPPFGWTWWWQAPDAARLTATLDTRSGRLSQVDAQDASGRLLLHAELVHGDPVSRYPTHLTADLPTLYTSVQVNFGAWRPADPPDGAFQISPPLGAHIQPLYGAPGPGGG